MGILSFTYIIEVLDTTFTLILENHSILIGYVRIVRSEDKEKFLLKERRIHKDYGK